MEGQHLDPAESASPSEQIPLGQRLFDNQYLLLVSGIIIVLILYTGWGLWEIHNLTPAPLP